MALIERWRPLGVGWPFREMERFRRELDRMMEVMIGGPEEEEPFEVGLPAVESFIEDGKLTIRMDAPGIDPKNIEVSVVGNRLTVRGSREEKFEKKRRNFIHREVRYGRFERSLTIPEAVKAEDLKAKYHDGVIELTAAMPKELAPKEVKVQVEGPETGKESRAT